MKRIPNSRFLSLIIIIIVLACSSNIISQESTNFSTIGKVGRINNCVNDLIGPDARIELLASGFEWSVDSYMGRRLNSPNDAAVKSNGDIYFTDPPYGLPKGYNDSRRELDFCGVFRLSISGKLTLLSKELTRPNGIAFSPEENVLYVAQSDSNNPIIKAFPLKPDGTLGKGKVLYNFASLMRKYPGSPDGLKVDQHGNLFATGPGGVYIITPEGELLGRIHTGKRTANCAWGDDGSVLYMTVDDCLCRIKTKTMGANW